MRKFTEIGRRVLSYIFSAPKGWVQLNTQACLVGWLVFGALIAAGAFYKEPVPTIPSDYRMLSMQAKWQFEKRLEQYPRTIEEIVLFEGVDGFVMHLAPDNDKPGASHIVQYDNAIELKQVLGARGVKFRVDKAAVPDKWADRTNDFGMMMMTLITIWTMISSIVIVVVMSQGKQMAFAGGPGGSSGRSAQKQMKRVTFEDVAGCDEAIDKLHMVVRWLKNPFWYSLWRARVPKGVLMKGPPGTGKTLLARAVAGEANLPPENFLTMSGSDFVEMFVGVGAKRVREKFGEAEEAHKKNGLPVIIFIDEIDAVGKARSNGPVNNDERDQTLNQLLVCMDGFEARDWLIILAATNRSDMLDPALLVRVASTITST